MKSISRILVTISVLVNIVTATNITHHPELFHNVITGIKQICLPDGKSLYGSSSAPMGWSHFERPSIDKPAIDSAFLMGTLSTILYNPQKPSANWLSFSTEYYTPAEIINTYKGLVEAAANFDTNALYFFYALLQRAQISDIRFPGLQEQEDRSKTYYLLYKWRCNSEMTDSERDDLQLILANHRTKNQDDQLQSGLLLHLRNCPNTAEDAATRETVRLLKPHSPLIVAH